MQPFTAAASWCLTQAALGAGGQGVGLPGATESEPRGLALPSPGVMSYDMSKRHS